MDFDYIIVQAGGKGTRLQKVTKNKPKALCPVDNLPMIFHLFNKFPQKKFIIIGDYKFEVLEKYLNTFANVNYILIKANGKGTCGGIKQAIDLIPDQKSFMIIWSDLILSKAFSTKSLPEGNYVGISKEFECRWSYENNIFFEKNSKEYGVAGVFIYENKRLLLKVPEEGEFVKWLSTNYIKAAPLPLFGVREFGTLLALEESHQEMFRCRSFNRIDVYDDLIVKTPLNKLGEELAEKEIDWYKEVVNLGFEKIPKIIHYNPLKMERITGSNLYGVNLSLKQKMGVIDQLVDSLETIHGYKTVEMDISSIQEAYFNKTIDRIETIRNLVPFADSETILINGKECRNLFYHYDGFQKKVIDILYNTEFALIHGDCTFSNILIDEKLNIKYIDPRGYFGNTRIFGDVYYDWAKLYYSIYGDYDQFNNKKFELTIHESSVQIEIESNGWRELELYYLNKIKNCDVNKIKFIHAIIWISLTTYSWEDYDAICGAFYNGLYYLSDFLELI